MAKVFTFIKNLDRGKIEEIKKWEKIVSQREKKIENMPTKAYKEWESSVRHFPAEDFAKADMEYLKSDYEISNARCNVAKEYLRSTKINALKQCVNKENYEYIMNDYNAEYAIAKGTYERRLKQYKGLVIALYTTGCIAGTAVGAAFGATNSVSPIEIAEITLTGFAIGNGLGGLAAYTVPYFLDSAKKKMIKIGDEIKFLEENKAEILGEDVAGNSDKVVLSEEVAVEENNIKASQVELERV